VSGTALSRVKLEQNQPLGNRDHNNIAALAGATAFDQRERTA